MNIANNQSVSTASSTVVLSDETPRSSITSVTTLVPIAAIFLFYAIMVAFVSPAGNFPLNDDWSYGESVRVLMQTGQLYVPTSLAAAFLHIVIGAATCKVFGYSYVVLRCTTIVIGLAGTLALFAVLREVGTEKNMSLLAALTYAANPLLMNVEFTFLSDVAAITATNFYLLFLLRLTKNKSPILNLLCATTAIIAAITIRQSHVVFAVCAVLALVAWVKRWRFGALIFLLLIVLPLSAYAGIDHWLLNRHEVANFYYPIRAQHAAFISDIFHSPISSWFKICVALGQVSCYLALFSLPILVPFLRRLSDLFARAPQVVPAWFVLAVGTIAASFTKLVAIDKRLMPFDQNLLRLPSVGASVIMGVNIPLLKTRYRMWLTGFSGFLACLLLAVLGAGMQRAVTTMIRAFIRGKSLSGAASQRLFQRAAVKGICFTAALVSIGFITAETCVRCCDRYYLMAVAPVLICLSITRRWLFVRPAWNLSLLIWGAAAIFSLCATQDYLSWNRARWQALNFLEKGGVQSRQIDGGAEYNFLRDATLYCSTYMGEPPRDKWRWWQVKGEEYIVSFSPIPEYDVIHQERYWSALSLGQGQVLVLKKQLDHSTLLKPNSAN